MSVSTTANYKIVVLGSGGVGKSALTLRLISDEFAEEYDPTIEDSYRKQVMIENEPALLDILDTAGQEEYSSLQDQWIREGDGYLIVYSIISKQTFEDAGVLREKIIRIQDKETFPLVLCGNKCDLKEGREVSEKDGKDMAGEWGCPFFETSAKTNFQTEASFFSVVKEIRKLKKKADQGKKKNKKRGCSIL